MNKPSSGNWNPRTAKQHAPIDETVPIPAAIRAAGARAAELHKQAYEEPTPPQPEAPPAEATPPAPAPQPEAPPAAQTPPAPQPEASTAQPDNGQRNWENDFKAMKGRYDSSLQTIAGLNGRISQLEQLLSRAPAPAAPPAQQRTPDLTFKPVTADERENFGDEFLDVAARAAAEKFAPTITSLTQELEQLKRTMIDVTTKSADDIKRENWAFLDSKMPNWRTVNRDQNFIAWANLPDPFSGVIRMAMIRDAFDKGDAPRVLRFYQGFLSDEAATGPAAQQTETPGNGKVPLESFAAPGRATSPAASVQQAPVEKETISHAQIAAFYLAVQKGHYKGNEAEKDRLERMIFEAQADGRVV